MVVVIPPNRTFNLTRRMTHNLEDAKEMVKEGREDVNHHFHGAYIVPEDKWAQHRFKADKHGNPVPDSSMDSLSKQEFDEMRENLETVDEADVEKVSDLREQLQYLMDRDKERERQLKLRDEEVINAYKAEQAKLEKAESGKPK